MKKTQLIWGAALAFLLPTTVFVSCSDDDDNDGGDPVIENPEAVVDNASLSNKVLRNLRNNNENTMYSPVSMDFLLGMIANGVNADVQEKTFMAMGFPKATAESVNDNYYDLMNRLNSNSDPKAVFSCVNAMWADKSISVKPDFISTLEKSYKASCGVLDFSSPAAADSIDNWADKATNGLIKKLNLNLAGQYAVISNACCFLADWTFPFDSEHSSEFQNGDGSINMNAHFMTLMEILPFASADKYVAVQLPYGNGTYVMDVVLPNKGVSTADLLRSLNWNGIDYSVANVNLNFVKFKAKNCSKLTELLGSLGFDDLMRADYSNIADGLLLSEIQQNTYIEVDALGTKAAAVSSATFNKGINPSDLEPVKVNVNRPFLFAIREKATGVILFMGDIENVDSYSK